MRNIWFAILLVSGHVAMAQAPVYATAQPSAQGSPRIVNIVNFIRLLEPRDSSITQDVLYQTVVRQVALMRLYKLRGTFLLQYDALMDSRYQSLMRSLPRDSFEIGAWWEIPQPLVEKAGMRWRGRYPWDWRANIGFATGYTPAEREKLVDTYMADFFRLFGYYPATAGSWFIDAHSLSYMSSRYHIVASCNCKDQYGTDGYTLWGGYWNQAYYPSKVNSYMPAQHAANQIPVPIFRMLGSDPIRQYDNGLGNSRQGVVTLEPVYKFGGGDSAWVHWFFDVFTTDPDLGFNYTQAGQENSFTWSAMAKGLEIQFPLIARLREEGKVRVETMAESGRWFRSKYPVTPPTSFVALKDISDSVASNDVDHPTELNDAVRSGKRTLWFDSRFYRANLFWEKGTLLVRDIHLFDEAFASVYEKKAATSNECRFFTLPFVDGYAWSKAGQPLAGMRIVSTIQGKDIELTGGEPAVQNIGTSQVRVRWPLATTKGVLEILFSEDRMKIRLEGSTLANWRMELNTANGVTLPFQSTDEHTINCRFEGMAYRIVIEKGKCFKRNIQPTDNTIIMDFSNRNQTGK